MSEILNRRIGRMALSKARRDNPKDLSDLLQKLSNYFHEIWYNYTNMMVREKYE
jgi:hypothetical protein